MIRFLSPAALTILLLLLACSGDDGLDASPTPTASPSSAPDSDTPTVRPTTTDVPVTEIAIGDAADFPNNIALIVETGCMSCDGPTTAFVRVYRRPDGSIAQDVLFTVEQLNLPDDDDIYEPQIVDFAIKHDASDIAVAVCVTGFCGGPGPAPAGGVATLYRSTDGGVTWDEWGGWPLNHWMIGLQEDGVLAGHQTNLPDDPYDPATTQPPQREYEFVVLPGGRTLEPPAAANLDVGPVVTDFGEVWWLAGNGRLVRGDGSVVLTLPEDATYVQNPRGFPKSGIALQWFADDIPRLLSFYDGTPPEPEGAELAVSSTISGVFHVGPLDPKAGTLYSSADADLTGVPLPRLLQGGLVPALIDLETHTAHPIISPFLDESSVLPNPRNFIVAFQRGPFARITGTGSCLNLRAEPSLSAEVLTCLADGVLLFADGRTTEVDGVTWLEVGHPSGPGGWAATAFLER